MKQGQALPAWLRRRSYPDRIKMLIAVRRRKAPATAVQADGPTSTIIAFPIRPVPRRDD